MIFRIALAALSLSAASSWAQTDVAPRIRPDGGALTPVVLTYVATLQQGSDVRALGERSVQLARTTYAGLSAWEIVETRGAGVNASTDSLIVDFVSLAPFHWGATQPMPGAGASQLTAARVSAEFRSDTMFGVMSSPTGRRNVIASMLPGAYVTAAHFEVALRAFPLAAGWRDSTGVMVSSFGKTASLPALVVVDGEAKLLTTAGTFDCWVVALTTDLGQTRYWVSKQDRIVVQSSQIVPETGATLVYQLSRISH
jgi:hypothetical protein